VTNSGRWKSKEKRMDLGAALTGVVDMEWMGPKAVGGDGDEAEARCICANAEEVEHGLEVVERAGTSEEASEVRIVAASRGGVAPRAGGHQSLVTDEVLQRTTVVTIGRKQTSGEEGAEGVQRNEEVTRNSQEATAEDGGVDGGRNRRRTATPVAEKRRRGERFWTSPVRLRPPAERGRRDGSGGGLALARGGRNRRIDGEEEAVLREFLLLSFGLQEKKKETRERREEGGWVGGDGVVQR
jgi:hypothetical protein